MNLRTNARCLDDHEVNIVLTEIPDTCPLCHRAIHPKNVCNHFLLSSKLVQAIFRCTSQKCEELFIATYDTTSQTAGSVFYCNLKYVSPIKPKKIEFPPTVSEVSPLFVDIYNQAMAAEANGLTEIVGIGFRKSIEFLVKDFATKQNPSKETEIKSSFLGKCIEDFIEDANVKQCAKRATWLANDETHYVRKWEDKDITDLKLLIHLTVNWIDNVLLTKKYTNDMSEGKKIGE
jgi:hypothetical protein